MSEANPRLARSDSTSPSASRPSLCSLGQKDVIAAPFIRSSPSTPENWLDLDVYESHSETMIPRGRRHRRRRRAIRCPTLQITLRFQESGSSALGQVQETEVLRRPQQRRCTKRYQRRDSSSDPDFKGNFQVAPARRSNNRDERSVIVIRIIIIIMLKWGERGECEYVRQS